MFDTKLHPVCQCAEQSSINVCNATSESLLIDSGFLLHSNKVAIKRDKIAPELLTKFVDFLIYWIMILKKLSLVVI